MKRPIVVNWWIDKTKPSNAKTKDKGVAFQLFQVLADGGSLSIEKDSVKLGERP